MKQPKLTDYEAMNVIQRVLEKGELSVEEVAAIVRLTNREVRELVEIEELETRR